MIDEITARGDVRAIGPLKDWTDMARTALQTSTVPIPYLLLTTRAEVTYLIERGHQYTRSSGTRLGGMGVLARSSNSFLDSTSTIWEIYKPQSSVFRHFGSMNPANRAYLHFLALE